MHWNTHEKVEESEAGSFRLAAALAMEAARVANCYDRATAATALYARETVIRGILRRHIKVEEQ